MTSKCQNNQPPIQRKCTESQGKPWLSCFSWEQRKVADVCSISTGKSNTQDKIDDGAYPFYVRSPIIERSNRYLYDEEAVLTVGDGVGTGKVFHYVNGKYDLHQRVYRLFDFSEDVDAKFFYHWFSENFYDRVMSMTAKTSVDSVRLEMIADMEMTAPSYDEQRKISGYLDHIDTLITLHQRQQKSGHFRCLEKTYSWEQRKLGEVGKARSGVGFPDSEQGGTTGTPFFKVSDMNTDGNENEMTVANNYVTDAQISARRWSPIEELPAIFFAKVGAAVMLNRKRLCRFPFLLDNNTMAYSLSKDSWDADFAKALFETVDLTSLVQVGALPSYNAGDVEGMEIWLPKLPEQRQIGAYFKSLDNLITLHQRERQHIDLEVHYVRSSEEHRPVL